ncbi:PREDICTED: transmembrane protein 70 homolog, mitochondrial [Dinoponera quadriceps]|uniref:Transmembrane protein 70 homolog, mitochondrial n=1 Tax=Dinoponera quadriceps TaxID=609295 RepID=A0A6P3XV63_DINQU|nr:PREDICTED: transmembrane protein 70 homolog, mitochondrial [Dinoponera quadriceps]XP_014482397.1 PREDICTED: transmembrane protein 70 homolog, mitochondrial [Dinoponera quadriceps]
MTLILRACVSAQKRFLHEDFSNFGRVLTYAAHNNCNAKRFPVACNVRHFSTKDQDEKAAKGISEIYYGNLTKQIWGLKIFSLVTSASGLFSQPFFYTKAMESGNTGVVIGIFAAVGFFAVSTPILLHLVTKKYVTHIYYDANKDKYIVNTYSLFVRKKEIEFTPEDVVVPDITGMFTNCIIKGTPLFLAQDCFYNFSHYIKIMGYDKPIDFKLGDNSNSVDRTVATDTECKSHTNNK